MNHGPLLFLAAFFALSASWVGLVLTPHMQVGQLQQTNTVAGGVTYPVARPGLAQEGLDVYRANGCAYCHSQQVGQTAVGCELVLNEAGTNQAALAAALAQVRPGLSQAETKELLSALPKTILRGITKEAGDAAAKTLNTAGAKAQVWVVPTGPDLARGWGKRRTVAHDFLFDSPVMLGSQRVGPDLANVGVRLPDPNWHLRHFYAPRLVVKDSAMPPYRFLFEKRKVKAGRGAAALELPPDLAPEPGFEVVPRQEAVALTAYMLSLRADTPLFEAPFTIAALGSPATSAATGSATNAPANVIATNSPPTNALAR